MRGYARGGGNSRFGAAASQNAVLATPTPNVDAQRYIEGRRMYYEYQTPNIVSLAAAASTSNVIQFDIDSIFCWVRTTFFTDLAGAAITSGARILPLATLQITDTGSGTNFFNNPIPIPCIAGSADLPFVLPAPQFIQPAASFQFAFANYSAATAYANLRIQLEGFKVYGSMPPSQLGG